MATDFNLFALSCHELNTGVNRELDLVKQGKPADLPAAITFFRTKQSHFYKSFSPLNFADLQEYQNSYSLIDAAFQRTARRISKLETKGIIPTFGVSNSTPVMHSAPATQADAIRERAKCGYITFYDDKEDPLTGCFGNFHRCPHSIAFDGKQFSNSEAIFQSRKFTDQPAIFSQFTSATSGDQAVSIAKGNTMSNSRLLEWDSTKPHVNKIDVMMNALRAKFGQNPELKEMLMATGSAYLCEHLPDGHRKDTFWSDGFNGTGGNNLGKCLMRLRGEYGGTGIVASPWGAQSGPGPVSFATLSSRSTLSVAPIPSTHTPSVATTHHVGVGQICMLPTCSKAVYQGYQFCGKTHGQEFVNSPLYGRCVQCNTQPKFYDRAASRLHQYCGKTCAKAAGKI